MAHLELYFQSLGTECTKAKSDGWNRIILWKKLKKSIKKNRTEQLDLF